MASRFLAALAATFVLLILGSVALVRGQGLPPYPVVYSGTITVAGKPAPDGLEVTARVSNIQSRAVTTKDGSYNSLSLAADGTQAGRTVTFWLNGQVMAAETDTFPNSGPRTRAINLTFPSMPAPVTPTPTPGGTPQPTPTPASVRAQLQSASPGLLQVRRGQEFTLEVRLDPQGQTVGQGQARLTFDARALRPLDAKASTALGNVMGTWRDEGGAVTFAFTGAQGPTQSGVALRVQFQVRSDAPGDVTQVVLEELLLSDTAGRGLRVDVETRLMPVRLTGVSGDVNGDGAVDVRDLALLGSAYNARAREPRFRSEADLNSDGRVDLLDLAILSANYGRKE